MGRHPAVRLLAALGLAPLYCAPLCAGDHPTGVWVLRHPREGSALPSPRLGYETSYGYDPGSRLLIRYGGHNQGGGGEQNSEVWTYDLDRDLWDLREPDDAPPGVCCAQQNVFDLVTGRFLRFPAFSGNHGWQSPREIALKNSSVWAYDLREDTWRDLRPLPAPHLRPLRGAAFDARHGVVVVHGGEGAQHGTVLYDPAANAWFELDPKPAPPTSISQPGFTFDPASGLFVLFGSQFGDDPRTWLYDLEANRWEGLLLEPHPPAAKTSPVLAADSRNGVVLAVVDAPEENETWVLDVRRRRWERLRPEVSPPKSGPRNRVLLYLEDRNLFVLENRTRNEQQIWTFRYRDAPAPPPPPSDFRVSVTEGGAVLEWQPPPGVDAAVYRVERADYPSWRGEGFRVLVPEVRANRYEDRTLERGARVRYRVRAIGPSGKPGRASLPAGTEPPAPRDLVVSAVALDRVELSWSAPPRSDITGYHVERAAVDVHSIDQAVRVRARYGKIGRPAAGRIVRIGRFERLTAAPVMEPHFTDTKVNLAERGGERAAEKRGSAGENGGKTGDAAVWRARVYAEEFDAEGKPYPFAVYAYRVRAVNRLGTLGAPSSAVFTFPSAVKGVFAREEEGGRTRLKWRANPEVGIQGYLVYRQDGRWNKDPIVCLTPEPIRKLEFLDPEAGERTRRYEVVAVDALGQEGAPSRPVWSRREWRRFYVPYVGEWHQ